MSFYDVTMSVLALLDLTVDYILRSSCTFLAQLNLFSSAIGIARRLSVCLCVWMCVCVCVCVNNLKSKTAEPIATIFGGSITLGV